MIETIKSAVLENRTLCSLAASCQWLEKSVKFTFQVDRWRNLIIIWLVLKCALLTSLIGGGGTSSSVISVSNGASWTFESSPAPPSAIDTTWTESLCRHGALWWISSCKINSNFHLSVQQNFVQTLMPYQEFVNSETENNWYSVTYPFDNIKN